MSYGHLQSCDSVSAERASGSNGGLVQLIGEQNISFRTIHELVKKSVDCVYVNTVV